MGQKIENNPSAKKESTHTFVFSKPDSMPLKYTKDDDGNFVCPHPGCGFTKRNQSTLHYHMKKHEEQLEHVCKLCKKQFLQKQTLDLHIRSKHPELIKDSANCEKKFKCPFDDCDFSALTKGNCVIHCLRVHFQDEIKQIMNIDNETKCIHCEECGKEFNSSCSFYYHSKGCVPIDKNGEKFKKFQEVAA